MDRSANAVDGQRLRAPGRGGFIIHPAEKNRKPSEPNVEFDRSERVLADLAHTFERQGHPVKLVYSSERDLDIVPAAAGKGEAVTYLLNRYGIPLSRVLTCGDSANDRDMLCLGGPAVAVGNARRELLHPRLPESVLHATGECSAGILEALHHYQWVKPEATLRGALD